MCVYRSYGTWPVLFVLVCNICAKLIYVQQWHLHRLKVPLTGPECPKSPEPCSSVYGVPQLDAHELLVEVSFREFSVTGGSGL